MANPLDTESLATLQAAVLGDAALHLGIRQSPVFVGQTAFHHQVLHYIAPEATLVDEMLAGLQAFERQTRGADPVARAAAVSFAFVYLHPLADGNGRVHRFLINHILAFDGAVPSHVIVPVSATISGSSKGKAQYDDTLELFSKPLMRRYASDYRFGTARRCPDGVETNFEFLATSDAAHAWRYPDLTGQARYLSEVLRQTVEEEMAGEAILLRQFDQAVDNLKVVLEMPNQSASRIITSLKQQHWAVSNKLQREFPDVFQEGGRFFHLKDRLIESVRMVYEPRDADLDDDDSRRWDREGRLRDGPFDVPR
ncbi:MAG: Fic family protein [Pigmentiphaga sp.]